MKDKHIKRKLLNDRKLPDSTQINKHQDFDRLHTDFSMMKKLLLKNIILWAGIFSTVAVAAVVVMLSILKKENNKVLPKEDITENTAASFILPPLPGKNVPYNTFRISARNAVTLTYPNGSMIMIPADAFRNVMGKPLSDSIDINYREFHNPLDIFLSGIPMTYDSAGTSYTFESAGMIEILAFDKGEPLQLNAEKAIQISMASTTAETRFNLYELDTENKKWIYKGKDQVEKPAQPEIVAQEKNSPQVAEPVEPAQPIVKPILSDPQKYSFKITYEPHAFPELQAYENVLFQVTDNQFKPAYFKINWDKISLYNGDEQGAYFVKLKKKDTTISVTAVPVFDQANYSKALAKFEEQHKQSAQERDDKELQKKTKLNTVNKELAAYNRNSTKDARASTASANAMAYRRFSVFRLGIYNCDFPMFPQPEIRLVNTLIEAGKKTGAFTYSTIFIIEKGKNTVFKFAKNEPIRCNLQATNLIWTITDKDAIAFFKQSDFTTPKIDKAVPEVAKDQPAALTEIKKFCDRF